MKVARGIHGGFFRKKIEVGAKLDGVRFVGTENQRFFAEVGAHGGDPVRFLHAGKAEQTQRRSAGLQIVAEPDEFTTVL